MEFKICLVATAQNKRKHGAGFYSNRPVLVLAYHTLHSPRLHTAGSSVNDGSSWPVSQMADTRQNVTAKENAKIHQTGLYVINK